VSGHLTVERLCQQTRLMFKMIGGDGQEYGPYTTEQMREHLAENRANGQTLLQPEHSNEHSTEWRPLATFPEFAEALGIPSTAATPPPLTLERAPGPGWIAEAGVRLETLRVGACLGRGWGLLTRHFILLTGATALVWLILTACQFVVCVGELVNLAIGGALYGGLSVLYLRLIRQQAATLGDAFSCWGPLFVPLMLVWIVSGLLSSLGLLFCLAPGLYLIVIWVFSIPLVADRQLGFWEAMEASRKVVSRGWFKVAALILVAYLPVIVFEVFSRGRLTLFLFDQLGGPASWTPGTLPEKLKQLLELSQDESFRRLALQTVVEQRIVLLLNLPFAFASLLHAYEDLFGQRHAEGG